MSVVVGDPQWFRTLKGGLIVIRRRPDCKTGDRADGRRSVCRSVVAGGDAPGYLFGDSRASATGASLPQRVGGAASGGADPRVAGDPFELTDRLFGRLVQ